MFAGTISQQPRGQVQYPLGREVHATQSGMGEEYFLNYSTHYPKPCTQLKIVKNQAKMKDKVSQRDKTIMCVLKWKITFLNFLVVSFGGKKGYDGAPASLGLPIRQASSDGSSFSS